MISMAYSLHIYRRDLNRLIPAQRPYVLTHAVSLTFSSALSLNL